MGKRDAFQTPHTPTPIGPVLAKMPVRPAGKKPAEKQYLWASVTFADRGSNDGSTFHGVFITKELALEALNVQDHLDNGATLDERTDATDVMYGHHCRAQVFKLTINRPENIEL